MSLNLAVTWCSFFLLLAVVALALCRGLVACLQVVVNSGFSCREKEFAVFIHLDIIFKSNQSFTPP